MDVLIAEDLLLLLLDDEKGSLPVGFVSEPVLGGALLVDLALAGHVELGEREGVLRTAKVRPVAAGEAPADPVLAAALATVASKARSADDLVQRLGKGVLAELLPRLAERGYLERRDRRVLGVLPRTTWPVADSSREKQLRERLAGVLVTGLVPDPRIVAVIALLSAVDQAHRVVGPGDLSRREVRRRAKEIATGERSEAAVRGPVRATQAAVAAAVTAATSAATSGGG